MSGESDARAVDERAGFDALLVGKGAQQLLGRGFGEVRCGGIAAAEFDQQIAGGGVLEKFRNRGGIEVKRVAEVGAK